MFRLLFLVLILILLISAFFLPKFRKALWTTVAIVLSVVVAIIVLDDRQREAVRANFPLDQVQLLDVSAEEGLNSRSYIVQGRIANHSEASELQEVVFEVTLRDCQGQDCAVVAQQRGRVSQDIPPQQVRDFRVTVPFSEFISLRGTAEWSFEVVDVNDR